LIIYSKLETAWHNILSWRFSFLTILPSSNQRMCWRERERERELGRERERERERGRERKGERERGREGEILLIGAGIRLLLHTSYIQREGM
jgi:hypothetical protein